MKKGKYKVAVNYMDTVYVPSENVPFEENDEGKIVLKTENKGFYNTVAQKLFHKPRFSYITLDGHGTVLWKCLDGKNSVSDILNKMNEAFPDDTEKMLDRTVHFLRILTVNKYIKRKE